MVDITIIQDITFIWAFINGVSALYFLINHSIEGNFTKFEKFSLVFSLTCGFWLFWLFAKMLRLKNKNFIQELLEQEI